MFETFNVRGLNISVQPVLSLLGYQQFASLAGNQVDQSLTGLVVDSGEGSTNVIPIADGFVISSAIREIPLAGKDVTQFVSDMLTDRGENIPAVERKDAARTIKEDYSYLVRDVVAEYGKFDSNPAKKFAVLPGKNIQIGYERFLAPELFFHPEIFSTTVTKSLPTIVDEAILQCPIDTRRRLYSNICLSGGSTTFKYFRDRMELDLQTIVDTRLQAIAARQGAQKSTLPVCINSAADWKTLGDRRKDSQRYAAWIGGSMLASTPTFSTLCKTKADYDEYGPYCMRGTGVITH